MSLKTTNLKFKNSKKKGFTLVEVILVVILISILSALILPNVVNSRRGIQINVTAKNIEKLAKFARGMSIIRESNHSIVFDLNRNIIYAGEEKDLITDDFEIENINSYPESGIKEEIKKNLSSNLIIKEFTTNNEEYNRYDNELYYIYFYPDGYCDNVELSIYSDEKSINIKSDPVSGKIISEFIQ